MGAVQMRSTDDVAANLEVCRTLTAQAAADGAQLVVLPECFSFLGRGEGDKQKIAEANDGEGPIMSTLRELATKHGVWIVGGGTPERISEDPKRSYNTAVAIDPSGALIAAYRKIHLFEVDLPCGTSLRESDGTAPGDQLVVADIAGVPVGLSICYDVRFPELYRELAKDRGAQILLVPAAFTAATGAAHWHLLLRARAVENQCWVVAPAQWGRHNEKRESYGHALISDPWGTIVAERAEGDSVIVATLDSATLDKRRMQLPALRHAVLWK
ncbi:MAG: Nitrilase/cyanide hydratase and apolipoprotein N-acyltransferase [Myxococcales bacterium]|nr:Nitrilase/cyanide hydratase and apolipoprotein N-acyltransferase [Myxococcales bacterium]